MSLILFFSSYAFAAYPSEVRQEFVNSCVGAGGTKEYCGCTMDKLEQSVSISDFESGSKSLQLGKPDPGFQANMAQAAKSCLTPEMYRSQFVPACEAQGASARYCICNYEYLNSSLGHNRLIDLSFDIQMGKKSSEFAKASEDAAASCADKAEYRSVFIKACSSAGADSGLCSCMYDFYESELGFKKLVRLDARVRNGFNAPELDKIQPAAQKKCLK